MFLAGGAICYLIKQKGSGSLGFDTGGTLMNLMEDKRIDYNAPLLSVRRFHSSISSESKARWTSRAGNSSGSVGEKQPPLQQPSNSTAPPPFYKSEVKSGPVRNPGVVPFVWEEAPGCPKEGPPPPPADPKPNTPKQPAERVPQQSDDSAPGFPREALKSEGRVVEEEGQVAKPVEQKKIKSAVEIRNDCCDGAPRLPAAAVCEDGDADEDTFSDALDALSRADTCLMNCSVGGMTGVAESVPTGSYFSRDPQVRDFMMGRFLPAAQAMATGSPHTTTRKGTSSRTAENNMERPRKPPQSYQRKPQLVPQHMLHLPPEEGSDGDDDDEEDGYSDSGQLPMKGCGFIPRFCLKGSLCLMNPVPGVRVRGGGPLPPARKQRSPAVKLSSRFGKAENEQMWEAVYRHKLGGGHQVQLEDGSKLTSESNNLTCWSDSLSPDGSSPYRRSTGGGSCSPYRNDASQSPFREGKGLIGFPKEDGSAGKADSVDSGSRGSDRYFEIQPHLMGKGGPGSESPKFVKSVSPINFDIQGSPNSKSRFAGAKEASDLSDEHFEVAIENGIMGGFMVVEGCKGNPTQAQVSVVAKTDASSTECNQDTDIYTLAAIKLCDQGKNDYNTNLQPLLPPPLPKSPSESWLSRTLPSVSSKNQAPQAFLGMKFHSKKKGDQISSAHSKWETVVKSSDVHTAQIRFSEVLANPIKEE